MKHSLFLIIIVFFLAGCEGPPAEESNVSSTQPSEAEIQTIKMAVPSKPTIEPLKPRRLLVFSLAWGYRHDVVPWSKVAFRFMAEKTKAFDVEISDDVSQFEPENLKQFDAVVFNNTNEEIFLPENFNDLPLEEQAIAEKRDELLKNSLIQFLKDGNGLAVIHAGLASFRKWPAYGNIIGARFDNHPWNAGTTVTLKVEEPDHPLLKAFPEKYFKVTDEIYQFKGDYSRDKLRVLLSIDTTKTDMNVKNIHRTDGDFAMSWIKTYGKGRVFYCALGHQKEIFWDPILLRYLLDGFQFVLGDLQCDTTPSAKIGIN